MTERDAALEWAARFILSAQTQTISGLRTALERIVEAHDHYMATGGVAPGTRAVVAAAELLQVKGKTLDLARTLAVGGDYRDMKPIRLTPKELQAVLAALSNSTDHSDVMAALFSDGRERRACWRGEEKLRAALSSARSVSTE